MSVDIKDVLEEIRLAHFECPNCGEPLNHDNGVDKIPEHDYCPRCVDYAYFTEGTKHWKVPLI